VDSDRQSLSLAQGPAAIARSVAASLARSLDERQGVLPVLVALYAVSLVARLATSLLHPDPAYPDSFYYVAVARSLQAGNGFSLDFIWNFVDVGGQLPAHPRLPIPSNAHWMPLASLVQLPFFAVLGVTPIAAIVPFALIGATAAPIAYLIARDASRTHLEAFAAGLMTAMPGGITGFLGQPDNFTIFMPLGALGLWLCARGLRGQSLSFVLGGLVVGLATLARNDGLLLGIPFAIGWVLSHVPRGAFGLARQRDPAAVRLPLSAALGCAGLFLLVMGPWYLRQLLVFGSISPSAASGRILWIIDYSQLWSVVGHPSLGSFLAQGWQAIAASRIAGFASALGLLAAAPFLFFLVPFVLWGAWRQRRSVWFTPWRQYTVTLVLAAGLLFAVHVPFGTFLHSAVAIIPHAYVLALDGIAAAVAWVASRRSHWNVARATVRFTVIAVVILWIAGGYSVIVETRAFAKEASRQRAAAEVLDREAVTGNRVMSADPGAYKYYSGLGGVVTPADPLPVVQAVARAYGVRWLVLERTHIVPSLADVYLGTVPASPWLVEVYEPPADKEPIDPSSGRVDHGPLPAYRIYAVCLDPVVWSARCETSSP
jgi:hypothetical protein